MLGWVLVIHVFGVIFWLGSLLVVSSLMGVTAEQPIAVRGPFTAAAKHLFNAGANLGAIITVLFGLWLLMLEPIVMREGWMQLKLGLVLLLILTHLWLWRRISAAAKDPSSVRRGQFAMIHGVVSTLLLAILVMVFVRPF
jgi:putative membrane protein